MTDSQPVAACNMELLRRAAPILRGLLADNGVRPALAFTPADAGSNKEHLPPTDDAQLLDRLRSKIRPGVSSVEVPCLGTFEIQKPAAAAGRVAGKLALVTGGAQGFGYEIATALAAQGARVALADINLDGAHAAARTLCDQYGDHCALPVQINVADSALVAAAYDSLLLNWGGVDLIVANAGVLRSGPTDTLAERDFDFVTSVNYKGYFLTVQHAIPILRRQHMAAPEIWSDIIQINSKSGLEGSNRNAPYAGSKFGGLGLTQSFALELVQYGIKVNSICPGNFFDGPLWSDPKTGLFVQYLNAGKVPGAQTIDDIKRFYEAKVPMGRGCTGDDVMRAIYYVVDQQYETGQALPVTGGQVMLN